MSLIRGVAGPAGPGRVGGVGQAPPASRRPIRRDRENTKLRKQFERLAAELGKARKVIEMQGSSPRC